MRMGRVMAGGNRAGTGGQGTTGGGRSGFVRLTELLAGIEPGRSPINLSIGEPHHPMPDFVAPVLTRPMKDFGR